MVHLDDGSLVQLDHLNGESPFILIFLRHFGCIFCRYQVSQLRPASDLPIFFVGMGTVEETAAFKTRMRSPHRFICDPERRLYDQFGVGRASLGQMISLRTIRQGLRATLAGQYQGKPTSDPKQLGAAYIVDKDGGVLWSKLCRDASEVFDAETLRSQLDRLARDPSAILREDHPGGSHPPAGQ